MSEADRILVVDDEPSNIRLLGELLSEAGYQIGVALDGEEALRQIKLSRPSLVLLDVVMPGLSGYEVCERLRKTSAGRLLPIILVTGARPEEERVKGLDAGADEFLTKPVNREELLARVRALLRVEALHREIEQWNLTLESRVKEQVAELERVNQLRNFLPPNVADLAVTEEGRKLLEPHRRKVVVCAVDLRGFTAFSEIAEPEEVIVLLREYYSVVGEAVESRGGTVERFEGDGMIVFFNAPLEIEHPERVAIEASLAVQQAFVSLRERWSAQGYDLGLGIGLSSGFATVGAIGFSGRWQYAAIGTVTNLSARLCSDARHGEVLASSKVYGPAQDTVDAESMGEKDFRGLTRAVPVFRIKGLKSGEGVSLTGD